MKNIQFIFEDNHLLVVKKPPNVLSQEDRTCDPDMLTLLKNKIKIRDKKTGNVFMGLVHRLDRPVGGVMVFAKTSKCAARLSEQIRKRAFAKTYLAVIHGRPVEREDVLVDFLLKDNVSNTVSVVDKKTQGAKKAVMDYEIIKTANRFSLAKIRLHTGRPHQIRVQLAAIGHPLYGDMRYGFNINRKGQQLALWSHRITCKHPTFGKGISFTSFPENRLPWSNFDLTLNRDFTKLSNEWEPSEKKALISFIKKSTGGRLPSHYGLG